MTGLDAGMVSFFASPNEKGPGQGPTPSRYWALLRATSGRGLREGAAAKKAAGSAVVAAQHLAGGFGGGFAGLLAVSSHEGLPSGLLRLVLWVSAGCA